MKRYREQKGYLYKASGVWYIRHHDDRIEDGKLVRKQVSTRVGLVKDFPAKELARKEAERILKPINESAHRPEAVQTLCAFAENQFFPDHEKQIKPSTYAGYQARWRQVKPWCCELRLRDTTTTDIQQVLNAIHRKGHLNHDSIRALRSLLKLIFDHAIRLGVLGNVVNPVDKSRVPKRRDDELEEETYAYSLEEVQQMLSVLPEPARTAVATCAFTGVRRGELAGLLWENFDAKKASMKITQSVWEGQVTRPKTKKSKAPVPVIGPLVRMLEAHRVRVAQEASAAAGKRAATLERQLHEQEHERPELREELKRQIAELRVLASNPPIPTSGPIFASARGTALNMNNLLNRQILPALNVCKVCGEAENEHATASHAYKRDNSRPAWHGWHAFRRGLGTNLKRLGVDLKTIQETLRHAHIATTADIYVKEVSEQAVEAMARLEKHIEAESKKHPKTNSESAYSAVSLQQPTWAVLQDSN